jgi:hypothetical protein
MVKVSGKLTKRAVPIETERVWSETTGAWQSERRTMKYLAILVLLLPSVVRADGCETAADALEKHASMSFRVIYSGKNLDEAGECKSVYAGISRHKAREPTYYPFEQATDAFPKVSTCRPLGTTTITRRVVDPTEPTQVIAERFAITFGSESAESLKIELWISPETGLILKRSERRPAKTTNVQYEYNNLNSPFLF